MGGTRHLQAEAAFELTLVRLCPRRPFQEPPGLRRPQNAQGGLRSRLHLRPLQAEGGTPRVAACMRLRAVLSVAIWGSLADRAASPQLPRTPMRSSGTARARAPSSGAPTTRPLPWPPRRRPRRTWSRSSRRATPSRCVLGVLAVCAAAWGCCVCCGLGVLCALQLGGAVCAAAGFAGARCGSQLT